jgi:dual-specificity kinase
MSTPSTATATLPHQNPHYGYSHHQNYQSTTTYRANNSLLNGTGRLGGAAYNFPGSSSTLTNGLALSNSSRSSHANIPRPSSTNQSPSTTMPFPQSASERVSKKRQRSREPDWEDFYKNGLPKEVIVIDDSPPPRVSESVEPHPLVSRNQTTRTVAGANNRHPAKKRKRDDLGSAYDPVYHLQNVPSQTQSPRYNNSESGSTISTDRTTSAIHTTAATSLGSQYSQSGGSKGYVDEIQPGQKRKRVATRQQLANEAKRREIEVNGDAFHNYKPPPRPPIKAPEVVVKVMQDVSLHNLLTR